MQVTIDDFKKIVDEEQNYYYSYQFTSNNIKYELCLECCFSGFDVALYKMHDLDLDYELVTEKRCTEHKGYLDVLISFKDRRFSTKQKAVRIANNILTEYIG